MQIFNEKAPYTIIGVGSFFLAMVGNAYICMLCIMIAVFWSVQRRMFSEQERNTPDGCNSYQAEYNSAYNGTLSSK